MAAKKKRKTKATTNKEILDEEKRLEAREETLLKEEKKVEELEEEQIEELRKLERIEKDIKKNTSVSPLTKITYRDFTKGFVGSMFVSVGHFLFYYSDKISKTLTYLNAHLLYLFALLILIGFLYFTGFRRRGKTGYIRYAIVRVCILFGVSLFSATLVLFLFGIVHIPVELAEFYKKLAIMAPAAVIGAATADLIGGQHGEDIHE